MDLRNNYFLKEMYTSFLETKNINLLTRMIRRRIIKLSLGEYKPKLTDDCFKLLEPKMREYLRVYLENSYCSENQQSLLVSLNKHFADIHAKKIWSDYYCQKRYVIQKCKEDDKTLLSLPKANLQQRHQPIINPRVDCNVFENTRGENLFPQLFPFKERPDFH